MASRTPRSSGRRPGLGSSRSIHALPVTHHRTRPPCTGIDCARLRGTSPSAAHPDLRRRDTGLRSAAIGTLVPHASGTLAALDGGRLQDTAGVPGDAAPPSRGGR
ncbi:hypothetical protein LT493_10090 [Streptomyces tricolor]|nr:hypothetical protein [Streptomyces tricolor]